ncbi:MAG: hypothetical protein ABI680_07280 [Chthoniobacteraceae bacterium]
MMITRRRFLESAIAATFAAPRLRAQDAPALPPVRAITSGPKFHWLGYYDKLQFDPSGRYVLSNQVDIEHRSPTADDTIQVGMVDIEDGDKWIELGESRAWNWQQGCMLQWLPGSNGEVIWNDREGDHFCCHILDVVSGKKRTLPHPIYNLSPDARWGIAPDFRRLNDCRPGYGYAGVPDSNREITAPDEAGIWRMDMATGERELIIPFSKAAAIPYPAGFPPDAKHWFNHLLFNQDGSRFIFLHRWNRLEGRKGGFATRLFTAAADGTDFYITDPRGRTSHFVWRDPKHMAAFASHPMHDEDRFYLFTDQSDEVQPLGHDVMIVNGHTTYLPRHGNEWILNDTYPDSRRNQNPYLYHVPTDHRTWLGHFHSPKEYSGEWRCDNHPRSNPTGTQVCIDSPHGGNGRQMYLIEISALVPPPEPA